MNIDFELLKKQKQSLLTVINFVDAESEMQKDLDGILHLLDALQDEQEDKPPVKEFPNGFVEWAETHHEIVTEINRLDKITEDFASDIVLKRHEEQGTGGLYELGIELADKFEQENKGVIWGEQKEWLDTMEEFLSKNL